MVLQRLVAWLVAVAVRRWPPRLREIVAREWAAELHALAGETGVRQPIRAWRQLRFASSLAIARPPRSGGGAAPLGWMRSAAPSSHTMWLTSAVLLTMLAMQVVLVPLQLIPFGNVVVTRTSTVLLTAQSYVILAGVAATIGTLLGRRLLRSRGGVAAGPARCAWTALPLIVGLLLLDVLARGAAQLWDSAWLSAVAVLCLILTLPPLAGGVAALSARGRRHLARAAAAIAAPVLTLAAMYPVWLAAGQAPAWPARLLARTAQEPMLAVTYSTRTDEPPVHTVLTVLPAFVFATVVLALAHAIRLAAPLPSTFLKTETPAAASRTAEPGVWWQRVLLGGAAFSVVAWAVTLAYLTPNIGVQTPWPGPHDEPSRLVPAQPAGWVEWTTDEGRLWMHELQLSAIVCATLCFLCALAFRGRPVLPALAGFAVLLATDMAVVRQQWTDPRLLPLLAAGGLALGAAARWVSLRLGTAGKRLNTAGDRRQHRSRRLVITVTVLASVLIPGSFFARVYALGKPVPPSLLLVAVGLPTVLTALVAVGVRATSPRPRRTPAWLAPVAVGIAGVLYYQDVFVPILAPAGESPLPFVVFMLPLVASVPVALTTAAAIHGRPLTRWRPRWIVLLLPASLIAGYGFAFGAVVASWGIAQLALFPMEYGQTYDGIAHVPGFVAIGLLLGSVAATVAEGARPASVPSAQNLDPGTGTEPQDIGGLGPAQPGPA